MYFVRDRDGFVRNCTFTGFLYNPVRLKFKPNDTGCSTEIILSMDNADDLTRVVHDDTYRLSNPVRAGPGEVYEDPEMNEIRDLFPILSRSLNILRIGGLMFSD